MRTEEDASLIPFLYGTSHLHKNVREEALSAPRRGLDLINLILCSILSIIPFIPYFIPILQYIIPRYHPNQCTFYPVFTGSLFSLPPIPVNDNQYKTTFRECNWILALNLKETTVRCIAVDQNKHNQKTISVWRFKNKLHLFSLRELKVPKFDWSQDTQPPKTDFCQEA